MDGNQCGSFLYIKELTNKSFCTSDLISDHYRDCPFLTETWLGTDVTAILTEAAHPATLFPIRPER